MAEIDPSYQLLACRYLRQQLDALIKQVPGIRANTDIEPVHQARVASRRIRAALGMFGDGFDAKQVDQWRKRTRKLTQGLGAARDLDVQIEFLDAFLAGLDAKDRRHRPGVKRLCLRLRQDRDAVQPKVVKTLDGMEKGYVMAEMYGEVEKTLFLLRHRTVSVQSPYALARTATHILERKRDVLTHEHALADPADVPGHHRLRIDAKRLRYTMEICDPVYGGQLGPFIKAVKKMQSLLGDIHDCDVWVENVEAFIEQERERTVAYYGHARPFYRFQPGLELVIDERRRHREATFAGLVEHWESLGEQHLWDKLDALLQSDTKVPIQPEAESENLVTNGPEEETNDNCPD